MKKNKLFVIGLTLVMLLFFLLPSATATVTPSSPSIPNGSTNVYIGLGTFTVLLNSSSGTTMDGNISLFQGSTQIGTTTSYQNQVNGTQTFTFGTLLGSTAYVINVNFNDTEGFNNVSYNFTTGATRLSENPNLNAGEILLIGFMAIMLGLFMVYTVAKDLKDTKKKITMEYLVHRLIFYIVMVVVMVVALSFL